MDVIERFAEAFWLRHGDSVTVDRRKAFQAILQCRTPALGGHRYDCDCGHAHYAWHSCNHRLCPQCGAADNAEWVDRQLEKLLPVPYFLVTFTLPSQLRAIALRHHELVEGFFKDSSEALRELLADPKRTGFTKNGFFGVYQSWSQQLRFHPHIHFVVPGVGLNARNKAVHLKKPDFLVYAQALANRLRTLLLNRLKNDGLIDTALFWKLWNLDWVADVEPAGSGANAVKYLGQYVNHSVISDHRILAFERDGVRIRIKNRDTGCFESVWIGGVEFVRRLLLHALPSGFHRIRYRGFLHARGKPALQWLQTLLDARLAKRKTLEQSSIPYLCPRCGTPMKRGERLARAPPHQRNEHFFSIVAA